MAPTEGHNWASGFGVRHAFGLAALILACLSTAPGPAAAATAARTGPPNSMTVLGDSISAGTGTAGLPSTEQKGNSWATGDNASVNSYYLRLKAINPSATTTNQSSNGKKMSDAAGQANSMPSNTELVLIEMGGNDLCKDTVDQMTSKSTYRSQFISTLNAIESRNPNALTFVSSIPDIYNLWFLRGAPAPPQDVVSSRAGTARTFWDTFGVIPCKSLVDNPTDMSYAANYRRWQVRDRTLAFNAILKEECEKRVRCRYDNDGIFVFSSNRILPYSNDVDPFQPNLYASYLPRAQWQFVDDDVSTIDHFHPSLSGHTKLARVAWEGGFNWSDATAPALDSTAVSTSPLTTSGIYRNRPTVTFNYSDSAGIKGIEYRVDSDGSPGAWQSTLASSVALQAVGDGKVNTFETRAIDVNGNVSASETRQLTWNSSATAIATPPRSVSATQASYRQALVSWVAPADDGASTVTGYRVERSTDGGSTWTDAIGSAVAGTSATVTGLLPATTYRFRVKAVNGVGTSAESGTSDATTRTLTVPWVPRSPTATGSQTSSSLVSWTAPEDDGGLSISKYTVTASPQVNGVTKGCEATGTTSCTVTGLINGTAYRFKVTATNSLGEGSASSETDPATPLAVPNAPFIGVATSASNSASVGWSAPDSDGGLAITGYTATATPQGGGDAKSCSTDPVGRSCTVTGLANGTTYRFRVTASNSKGTSSPSGESNAVIPVSVPAAPAVPGTTIGNGSISVTWVAPFNGGAAITGYTATATPQGGGTAKSCTASGSGTGCTITGLSNGTAYLVTVVATNSQGDGHASDPSDPVTPKAVPGAPSITSTSGGNGSVTVNWSAPASSGGSSISGYTVTVTTQGGAAAGSCSTGGATSCTVSGLTNGVTYSVTVKASNSAGSGPSSSTATAMPATRPASPTITTLTRGDGAVTIGWAAPSDNGGTPVTSYRVSASPQVSGQTKTCETTTQTGGSLATSCTISGLVNGQAYTFTAVAINRQGTSLPSPLSDEATPATLPGLTTIPVAVAGNGLATINWNPPSSNGGSAITGYRVTASPSVGGLARTCTTTGATSCVVSGLTNGQAYTFTVVAITAVGTGLPSGASAAVTPLAPPPPVTLTAKTSTPVLSTTAVNLSTSVNPSVAGKITVTAVLVQGTKTVGTWTATKTVTAGGAVTVTSKSTNTVRTALKKASGAMTVTTSFAPNSGTAPAAIVEKMTIAKKS